MRVTLPNIIIDFIKIIYDAGYEAYAVGGCVRDLLLGKTPNDWDITTNAFPEEIKSIFSAYKTFDVGIKHGTVTVLFCGEQIEVTTFRTDGNYIDHRHPDKVSFSHSLKDDLSRRDFTINAIAYSPSSELIDIFGGVDDLNLKTIRCVGDADKRFNEDALRIMRAMRFSSVLGFNMDDSCKKAVHRNAELLKSISNERISSELKKMLCGGYIKEILMEFGDVISYIIPEIYPMLYCSQNHPYHIYNVWEHTAEAVASTENNVVLRLTMLFHDIGKPRCIITDKNGINHFRGHAELSAGIAEKILVQLRFESKTVQDVVALVKYHDMPLSVSDKQIMRVMNRLSPELFFMLISVREADIKAQSPKYLYRLKELEKIRIAAEKIISDKKCIHIKDLAVNGNDIVNYGIKQGPLVGEALKFLLNAVIESKCENNREDLLTYLYRF